MVPNTHLAREKSFAMHPVEASGSLLWPIEIAFFFGHMSS